MLASYWAADAPGEREGWRLVEVVEVGADEVSVWAYAKFYASVPPAIDVSSLRKIKLHDYFDGPLKVPWEDWKEESFQRVRRL